MDKTQLVFCNIVMQIKVLLTIHKNYALKINSDESALIHKCVFFLNTNYEFALRRWGNTEFEVYTNFIFCFCLMAQSSGSQNL